MTKQDEMSTESVSAALVALSRIEQRFGKELLCCGNPMPGHPGDGWMQPPDGPYCCQEPDTDMAMLCEQIRAAISSQPPAPRELQAEFENYCAKKYPLMECSREEDNFISALEEAFRFGASLASTTGGAK